MSRVPSSSRRIRNLCLGTAGVSMFFVFSKILGFFALPSNLMMLIGLVGAMLLFTRRKSLGRGLIVLSVMALAAAGWSPLGNRLLASLEDRFPPWSGGGTPDGILVLGGAISPEVSAAR